MARACRIEDGSYNRKRAAHAGLLLSRYLPEHDKEHQNHRDLIRAAADAACRAAAVYGPAFARWEHTLSHLGMPTDPATLPVLGRLAIGLGNESVLENGLTLHHTYGVPVIPGSALKGLAAHYCDQAWGNRGEAPPTEEQLRFRGPREARPAEGKPAEPPGDCYEALFGSLEAGAGRIVFHDAWIHPDCLEGAIQPDVITVHHQKYYQAPEEDNTTAPTDFDEPTPIPFASVTGNFLVAVSCDDGSDEGAKWAMLALDLLREALREWGVGAKTNSSYGRLGEHAGAATPVRPRHKSGDVIEVERIADPKGKGRAWFRADDGSHGHLPENQPSPVADVGDVTTLRIASVGPASYTFALPKAPGKPPAAHKGKGKKHQ